MSTHAPTSGSGKRPIDKVCEILQARGLRQNALAAVLGLPHYTIAKWKAEGEGQPSPYQLLQTARWLGMGVEYFIDHQMTEPPPPAVTDDELLILRVVRALGIAPDEAIRRLSHASELHPGKTRPTTAEPKNPSTSGDRPTPQPRPSQRPQRQPHR